MKKLCLAFIIFSFGLVYGQNVISLTFQPTDLGYGFRYDRLFNGFGLYAGATKGEYKLCESYVKDHTKISWGGTLQMREYSNISLGASYHEYGKSEGIPLKALRPVSFDIGAGVSIKRFVIAFRMDLLKGEGCIDIGIKL